ncbi:BTAD domain-containing putative transcriptional regulator [Streptomyces sp. NPDC052164]|uniref:AfsR/SARP family transcriptional regulator n=1 Tax=Streptomyces sp. NPDC052164 TaxID=3155529 RepID=UPI003447BCC5
MSRQVLSLLLAHANHVVTLESLVEELWGDAPPRLARKTVQTYIYHVRKALREGTQGTDGTARAEGTAAADGAQDREPPRLETESRGYRLRVAKGQLDLWRFEELCAAGQAAQSRGDARATSDAYREALALWRGRPFSGSAAGVLLSAQQARLEDLRMGALERRVEADMALGHHRELLSELKGLAIDHPLSEVICGQLMTAATRSGQRQVALDAYSRLRAAMIAELGLEPSTGLRSLQQSVLEDAAPPGGRTAAPTGTWAAPASPAELPPGMADCVARQRDVSGIVAAVGPVGAGADGPSAVRIALVTGAVGTGKTATAVQAAHRLRSHYPGGQLFTTLHRPDGTPVPARDALASLLLSSGYAAERLPDAAEDLARLFRSWTSERQMLVVLDDASSGEQVIPLLPSSPGCSVVITSRRRMEGLPGTVTTVPLRGMSPDEGVALLGGIVGARRVARERSAARELVELYGGLPLALRALGRRLSAWPNLALRDQLHCARGDGGRLAVLQGPQDDCLSRLGRAHLRLAEAEQNLLFLLSDLPQPILERDLWQAAALSGLRPGEFSQLVESLVASHFLEFRDSRGGPAFAVPVLTRLALPGRTRPARRHPPREVATGTRGGSGHGASGSPVLAGAPQ